MPKRGFSKKEEEWFGSKPRDFEIPEEERPKKRGELEKPRDVLMDEQKECLEEIKSNLREVFGEEKIPKELVLKMVAVRKEIASQVDSAEYLDKLDNEIEEKIRMLTAEIAYYKEAKDNIAGVEENEDGDLEVQFKDGRAELLDKIDEELLESLRTYFDAHRMAKNAGRFRKNVRGIENDIVAESAAHKLNIYSEEEKYDLALERLGKKYKEAGFTDEELKNLIDFAHLERLDQLEIHEIKILAELKDIFERFMDGDKAKYIALSAVLSVPAFLQGYAPKFLADAFKSGGTDMVNVVIYALLTASAAGGSVLLNKHFNKFLDKNFKKEGGMAEHISENVPELPGEEIKKIGPEAIKNRIAYGKGSYETVLRTISASVVPSAVTILTSAVALYQKSPALAAGSLASASAMVAIDHYINKKGKFWQKEGAAKNKAEERAATMEELLKAHMEIILAGEKEKFIEEFEELLVEEKMAVSDKRFLELIREKVQQFYGSLNIIISAVVGYLAGGSADKFVAALAYSGQFNESISKILDSKRNLLESFRDIMQMDLMFNGYATEEKEKEKDRVGMNEIGGGDLKLRNVSVEYGNKAILKNINLDLPQGSLAYLEGASGAGKTTLMKVLAGYYRPTSGAVEFGGVEMGDIKKSGENSIYSRIAYLSQFPYILDDSLRQNITFGTSQEIDDAEIKKILKEVGLSERFGDLNEELSGGRGDAGDVSGGEASRIGLARILLKIRNSDSRIVFLDEPTASVDEETRDEIAKIINKEKAVRPNATFIVISHDKEFVKQLDCSIKVRMKKGEVKEAE